MRLPALGLSVEGRELLAEGLGVEGGEGLVVAGGPAGDLVEGVLADQVEAVEGGVLAAEELAAARHDLAGP